MPLVCFASPKGGVGKTTLAANVADQLAQMGHRVIALDLDPQNSLRLHFGVGLHDPGGYTAGIAHQPDWRAALRTTPHGAVLLPYGQADFHGSLLLAEQLTMDPAVLAAPLRDMLAEPDRIVVADTMPGPSAQLSAALGLTDLLVTVLLADALSVSLIGGIEDGRAYNSGLDSAGLQAGRTGFVLNQIEPRTRLGGSIAAAAARHLGPLLLGTVYRDENVAEAVAAQKPVVEYAPASKAAADIAALANEIANHVAGRPWATQEGRRA
jgi:cellulose synthase operon protein YhjQ